MKKILVLLSFLFLLYGCTKPFVIACRELATLPLQNGGSYGWTEDQAKAACAYNNRLLVGELAEDKITWQIDYQKVITTEEVLSYVQDQLKSLDLLLSYKDSHTVQTIDFFKNFRYGLENKEKELKWVEQRLKYIVNFNSFVDKVGEIDNNYIKELMPYGRKAYSLRLLYPVYDFSKLKFTADYLESAKKDSSLKLINTFPIIENKIYGSKVIDNTDPNKFTWKKHQRGWLIKAYKIISSDEVPSIQNIDYLEIYKAKFDSLNNYSFDEEYVISGFKSRGKDMINIFVIDYNYSTFDGFNPDKIFETFISIVSGEEVYRNDFLKKEILDILYESNDSIKEDRIKPSDPTLYTQIVKMGQVSDIKVWEEGTFTVPFNYIKGYDKKLELKFKEHKNHTDTDLRQILYFKVEYLKDRKVRVIEYYSPDNKYDRIDIREGYASSNTFVLRKEGLPRVEADVNFFSKGIKTIQYEFGNRWYQLVDEDFNGVFEKRRKIGNPTDINMYFEDNIF